MWKKFTVQLDLSQIGGEKSYDQCFADYLNICAKLKLSEVGENSILKARGQQRKGCSVVANETAEKQKLYVIRRTVNKYHHRDG